MQTPTYNEILTAITLDKRFDGFSNLTPESRKLIINLAKLKTIILINASQKHTVNTAINYWAEIIKANIDILADIEQEFDERGDL